MQGSRKLKDVKATVDELREEDATRRLDGRDPLVEAIQETAKAARALLKGRMSEWAVFTLVSEASGVPKRTVMRVLQAARDLEEKCLRPKDVLTDGQKAKDAEKRLLGPFRFLDAIAETANITRLPGESDNDLRARIDARIDGWIEEHRTHSSLAT